MLGLPPGAFTLEKQAVVSRSNTILRGAGRDRTWLYLPNSMTDLFGGWLLCPGPGGCCFRPWRVLWQPRVVHTPSLLRPACGGWCVSGCPGLGGHPPARRRGPQPPLPMPAGKCKDTGEGYWVWTGALVTAKGPKQRQAVLAKVDASTTVPRGSYTLKVRPKAAGEKGAMGLCAPGAGELDVRGPAPPLLLGRLHPMPGRPCLHHAAAHLALPPGEQHCQAGGGADRWAALQRRQRGAGQGNVSATVDSRRGVRRTAGQVTWLVALAHVASSCSFPLLLCWCSMNNHLDPGNKYG